MGSFTAWFTSVVMVLGAVIVFNHLGVNLSPLLGSALHGIEHALGMPLTIG
ncbi:MAG: hypothetical protein L3K19_09190 [Thermoplasmata archaeon]|nr:hypothetical protein [Thermoplasmata archaeon]